MISDYSCIVAKWRVIRRSKADIHAGKPCAVSVDLSDSNIRNK